MLVTVLGMVIPVSDVQLKNALLPMVVSLSGRVISVSDVQLANVLFPMVVTPLPMLAVVSPEYAGHSVGDGYSRE